MLKVDNFLELILRLYDEFRKTRESEDEKVLFALHMLGLVEHDRGHDRWKSTPELIRLAYESKEFVERNKNAIDCEYGKRQDRYKAFRDTDKQGDEDEE
jgi:hypothetical protein